MRRARASLPSRARATRSRSRARSPRRWPASLRVLFGEGAGGFLVSGANSALDALAREVHVLRLGTVGGRTLRVALAGSEVSVQLHELRGAHAAIAELFA